MPRVLIANRGEIARRILRTCREHGFETVAVYSRADAGASYLREADRALCIGESPAASSYLSSERVLSAALATHCDGIHPGYGFFAEDAQFAQAVLDAELLWIGPRPETLELSGDKAAARRFVASLGVPVVPGTARSVADEDELRSLAARLGFPLLLKATHGGGGRGMRRVERENELLEAFRIASQEAERAAGRAEVYLERALGAVRHIEVQLLGDGHGQLRLFSERHCSLQLRHQKVIEECPGEPLAISRAVAERVSDLARQIGTGLELSSAATVEFLVDDDERIYFLEINPRLQVEHGLTELVHGIDLVRAQLEIAFPASPGPTRFAKTAEMSRRPELPVVGPARGHAIECRINAEDPWSGRPSPGMVRDLHWPLRPGVRIDTALQRGGTVPSEYDSLVAKVMTWGEDRPTAISRMQAALSEISIVGIRTNLELLREVMASSVFAAGDYDTKALSRHLSAGRRRPEAGEPESRAMTGAVGVGGC